jgi:hypothetical protein
VVRTEAAPALAAPVTQPIPVVIAPPVIAVSESVVAKQVEVKPVEPKRERPAMKSAETFLAGPVGEERAEYMYRCNSDGSVRETLVYFYGDDLRASQACSFDPLRREAVYHGRADASRLHEARKLSDTLYVGELGHERRDLRRDYRSDGSVSQTVLFFYEGDRRAAYAPSGAPLRRQETFDGPI